MNGWVIDLLYDGGESMHVAWAEVVDDLVSATQWLEVGADGECFRPAELRGIFRGAQHALTIANWAGHAGAAQYIDGPIAAHMAANEANLIERRVVDTDWPG